jgi:hypothetical protein
MYTNVFEAKANANSDNKSPLPNPLPKDSLLPLPFPLPKNFSLPVPLPFGSEKAAPANAYHMTLLSNPMELSMLTLDMLVIDLTLYNSNSL